MKSNLTSLTTNEATTTNDISESAALNEARAQLAAINRAMLVVEFDLAGHLLSANDNFLQAFGYQEDEVLGKHHRMFVHPDYARRDEYGLFWQRLTRGEFLSDTFERVNKQGESVWLEANYNPIFDTNDKIYKIIKFAINVTQSELAKQAASQVQQQERLFRDLLDSAPDAMIIADANGKIRMVNKQAEYLFGYTREELIGELLEILIPERYRHHHPQKRDGFFRNPAVREMGSGIELFALAKDGREIPIELSLSPIQTDEGLWAASAIRDISERRLANQQLQHLAEERKQQEKLFRDLLDSAPDAMIIADASGTIRMINKQAELLFGYQRTELIGKLLEVLIPERYRHHHPHKRDGFFHNPSVREMGSGIELFALAKNGREIPIELSLSPIQTDEGLWAASAIRDISERRLANQQLQAAMKAAEEATKTKSDFLANMSHEIRTPMNAIIGMSYLALQTDLNPQQRNYVSKVHRSAESLLGIINDILDFSKIEAGMLTIEKVPFNLADVLQRLADVIAFKAEENGIELLFSNTHNIPSSLIGDPLRLGQILMNLGSNAVKFTHDGEIIVDVRVTEETSDGVTLTFSIKDSGIGMTPEQQSKLFQSFSQADASTTRKYGGTGLGLTISKRLIELMNGRIWLDSEAGKGSNFQFTAKFGKQTDTNLIYELNEHSFAGKTALVVDNNRYARQVMTALLTHLGFEVESVSSGEKAISFCRDCQFDVILMDWLMPGMDGLATTHKLAEIMPQLPPVIMATAYGHDATFEEAKATQLIQGLIAKPITISSLSATLAPLFGQVHDQQQGQSKHQQHQHLRQIAGAHLLLVEDNLFNQELATAILASASITATLANNGQEALDILAADPNAFDGILMDCQMPVMDGYTATRLIREQSFFKDLPILAMTANAMSDDREKVLAVGMNEHIAKPIDIEQLFATLARWIKPKRNLALTSRALSASLGITEATSEPETNAANIINRQLGLKHTNQNEALYQKMLCAFYQQKESFIDLINQLKTPSTPMLHDEVARNIHSLKGMSATIGAQALAEQLLAVEQAFTLDPSQVEIGSTEQLLCDTLTHLATLCPSAIPPQTNETKADQIMTAEVKSQLAQSISLLKSQLTSFDAKAVEHIEQMQKDYAAYVEVSNQLALAATSIHGYDFDLALAQLEVFSA